MVSTERMGLVLLLCAGVELELLTDKCELNLVGSGRRTMAGGSSRSAEETRETQKNSGLRKGEVSMGGVLTQFG